MQIGDKKVILKFEPLDPSMIGNPRPQNQLISAMTTNQLISIPSPAERVGIVGLELYFPSYYVSQQELELDDGVSQGKYTVGLGQETMAVCMEDEDAISMALTGTKLVSFQQTNLIFSCQ